MRRLLLSLFFLFTIHYSLFTTAASAATGAHTSYGHQLPYFFCGATSGLPVTLLISLNADQSYMTELKNCYQNSSHIIVRLMDLSPTTTDRVLLDAATRLQFAFGSVASKTYLVFGNEVNVIDSVEYQCVSSLSDCARNYVSQFQYFYDRIGGVFDVAAAPLNLSHPTYNAATFLAAAASAYQTADFYASNSYREGGCPGGYDPIRCTQDSWQWYGQQLGDKGISPILTEYGISPGLTPTLPEVINFLATQAPSGLAVTPLVQNTCSGIPWDWLIYIRGQLYDPDGNFVDPNTCVASTAPASALYRDPRLSPTPFSQPLAVPCNDVVPNYARGIEEREFHPLRPYPASPCDPQIPRSNPEALIAQDKYYMSFACGKSVNVSGTYDDFLLYQDPATLPPFPTSADQAIPGELYRCSSTSAPECNCPVTTPPSQIVCAIMRSKFNIGIDLSNAQLPIVGNTQDPIDDATRVNQYLDWYLNGPLLQSEQIPIDPYRPAQIDRMINFSGPLKKLLPFSSQQEIRRALVTDPNGIYSQYHNYMIGCQREIINIDYLKEASAAYDLAAYITAQGFIDLASYIATHFTYSDLLSLITAASTNNFPTIQQILLSYPTLLNDLFTAYNTKINPIIFPVFGNFLNKITLDHAISCDNATPASIKRLFEAGNNLPPDPSAFSGFTAYWKQYLTWTGRIALDIPLFPGTLDVPWLSNLWAELFAQIPFSNLEDTVGEVTFSLLPLQQPGLNSPFDATLQNYLEGGFIYPTPVLSGTPAPPNAIQLTVTNNTDTRLYFPHLRNTNFLAYILQQIGRPQDLNSLTPGRVEPSPAQIVREHQGLAEDGTLTKKDVFPGSILDPNNNNSILPAPPLFTEFDQRCDLQEARVNPGDTLYGRPDAIKANVSYTTFLTFQSQHLTSSKIAPAPDPNDAICGNLDRYILVTPTLTPPGNYFCARDILTGNCYYPPIEGDNCGDLYWEPGPCDNLNCPTTRTRCLQVVTPAPEQVADCNGPYVDSSLSPNGPWPTPGGACQEFASCVCTLDVDGTFDMEDAYTCQGANPDKTLPSEARVGVFTKTPFVERLYETLVAASDSVLRRFIPGPNTPPGCDAACMGWAFQQYLPHGPGTLPAGTNVNYTGGVDTSYGQPPDTTNPVSAGAGGQAMIYFPRLGSLYDYFLGGAGDTDPNLQKLLRPQGFLSAAIPPPGTGPGGTVIPGICPIPTAGYCSLNDPVTQLTNVFKTQAPNAAQICNAESGGDAGANNFTCPDYSVGLFQINLICSPNTGFLSYSTANLPSPAGTLNEILARARSRIPIGSTRLVRSCYDAWWHPTNDVGQTSKWACANPSAACSANYLTSYLVDPQLRDDCVTWFEVPQNNVAYAYFHSSGGADWGSWTTAAVCGIN